MVAVLDSLASVDLLVLLLFVIRGGISWTEYIVGLRIDRGGLAGAARVYHGLLECLSDGGIDRHESAHRPPVASPCFEGIQASGPDALAP